MADVQLENGYCKIANPIMDALGRTRIPGEARQVLDVIIRKTYGWNKKEETITNSDFMELTSLSHVHVRRALDRLIEMNLIICTKLGTKTFKYGLNKDFDKWKIVPKKVRTRTQKGTKKTKLGTNLSSGGGGDKDLPAPKDTIKDNKDKKTYCLDSPEIKLGELFVGLLDGRSYPWSKKGKPDLQKWAIDFDKIIRIDGRDPKDVATVLHWCQQDNFWQDNILSPATLRKQYSQLVLKMRKSGIGNQTSVWRCEIHGIQYDPSKGCPKCNR